MTKRRSGMKHISYKILLIFLLQNISTALFSQTKDSSLPPITVYIFLSESCPICESYTLTLKQLYSKYNSKNVAFIGVFPNYYADADSIAAFKKKYSIPFELIIDTGSALTKKFKASITPEVFVSTSQMLFYSGRIDDSFYALGKRRKVITSSELDDALSAITENREIKIVKTEAVGCIISVSK